MRSKEEQERIVKRALSEATDTAKKPEIGPPSCSNCGNDSWTLALDIHGQSYWKCDACAVGDGTDRRDGIVGSDTSVVDQIIEGGEIVAVLICSKILESHMWLSFSDDFNPADGLAVFYAHELEREIHKVKVAFGPPGSRVRQ